MPSSTSASSDFEKPLKFAVWLLVAYAAFQILRAKNAVGWDFEVYYNAARAADTGLSPYNAQHLVAFSERGQKPYPWVYPPLVLFVFKPFTLLPFRAALLLWLAGKAIALTCLLRLWNRWVVPIPHTALAVFFFLVALNGTLIWEFATGNVALFETLGVWGALVFLLRGRWIAAAVLLAVAAQFKVIVLAFAGLFLILEARPQWRPFLICIGIFVFLFGANLLLGKSLFLEFLRAASQMVQGRGPMDSSLLAFARDVAEIIALPGGLQNTIAWLIYIVAAAVILVEGGRSLLEARRHLSLTEEGRRLMVLFCVATYALVIPRFVIYGTALVLPLVWYIIRKRHQLLPAVALLGLLPLNLPLPLGQSFFLRYSVLLTLLLVWIALQREVAAVQTKRAKKWKHTMPLVEGKENRQTPTLAVLGTGKMGGALVRGWAAAGAVSGARARLYDPHRAAVQGLAEEMGAAACATPEEAVTGAELLLLAVKPHLIVPALEGVREVLSPTCLIVSIAAGVVLRSLESVAPDSPIIRVMPNTPALLGAGASAFCRGAKATSDHAVLVEQLFGAVGKVVEVTETQMDAVIGVSGSGPAYFYLLIEALADGGVRAGLPRDVALTLAAQTALGAARMVLENGEHPAVLKDAVTTPGGTTIAALEALERRAVRAAMIEAVLAARDRAREMG